MSIALDPSKVNSEILDKIDKAKSAMQEAYSYSEKLYNSLPSTFSYKTYTKNLRVNVDELKSKIVNSKTKVSNKYDLALNIEFNHSAKVNSLLTNFSTMSDINAMGSANFAEKKSVSSEKRSPSDSLGTKIASKSKSILGRLKDQVVDVSTKVGTFCSKAKSAVCNAVEKAWDWVSDGENWAKLGTKISNGTKSAWNFVTDKQNYVKLVNKIADYAMDWVEDPVGTLGKTMASIGNACLSFLKGIVSLVEAIGDFALILVALRDSIYTGIIDEITYLWSGESLGLTEDMWKKKVVPMVSYNWTNALDEKLGWRQWLDNYAYDAFKTDGMGCQIFEGVGYVAGIIAISALTFGAGGAAAVGTSSMSAATTAVVAGAAGMGKGTEEAWSQQADQKVLRMATEELNKEIEQGIVTQEMFDEKVKELLKENPEIQLTEEDVSVAIYNDLLAKKVEEINKRPGARELSNDEIVGGLGYGTMTGVIDGVQWYAGQKINGLFKGSGTKITNKAVASLLRIGADTVDAVAEIPFRTYAQTLYRTDENGNKMSFSEVFEANGGWDQVKLQTGIATVASGFGEIVDVTSSARSAKKIKSFLNGDIKPRSEITDKIIDKVNKSISKMKDIDVKNYLESLDGMERVKAFDQIQVNQQMAKSLNSLDDISLKKLYGSLDEVKQSQILGMVNESKKSFLVAQSGDKVARSLTPEQIAIDSQKDSFNQNMNDIRNNNALDDVEKFTQMRNVWEEDLKALFGEENVFADEVDDVIAKSSKVQQGVKWENNANERQLIEELYNKRDTLPSSTVAELEQNQYWQRIVQQNEENLQLFNTRFKNYSDTYSPRILTDEEILLAKRTMSDTGQLRDLRWTYMQRNLGIDMNNVPESVLTAEVKSLDDALFQEIGSKNSYYRQVCIEDLIGSATKSGDAQTGYTFFEKMLLDKGYDTNAKTYMFTDPVNSLKNNFPDSNIGKEAITGNGGIDLLEHNGKYFIGEDGNHRMVTLKVQFMNEMANAKTAEEMAQIRTKYTFTLPVKSLDLPIPDVNTATIADTLNTTSMIDNINSSAVVDSVNTTKIAESVNASSVSDLTNIAKNIDDNLFDKKITEVNLRNVVDTDVEIPRLTSEVNATTISSINSNGFRTAGDLIDNSNVLKRAGDLPTGSSASQEIIRTLDLNKIKEFNSAEVAYTLKNGDVDVIKRVFKDSELSELKKSLYSLSDTEINKVVENIDLVDYHKLYRVLSESDIAKRIDVLSDKGLNKVINMLRAEKNGLELLSMNKEFVDGVALKANVDTLKVIFSTNAESLKYKLSKQLDDVTLLSLVGDGDGYFENLLKKYPLSEWITNKEEAAKFVPVFLRDNVIKPENFAEIDSIIKQYNLGRNFSFMDKDLYFMAKSTYEQFVFENTSDINIAKNIMMNKSPEDTIILLSTEQGKKVFKDILYTVDDAEFNKYLARLDDFSFVDFDGIDEVVSLMERMDTDNIDTLIHSCAKSDINEILNKLDSTQLNRLLKMSFQYTNTSTALTNSNFLENAISLNLFSNSDFNMYISQIIKNGDLDYKNFKTIKKYSSSSGFFKKYHLNLGDYDSRVLDATTFGYNTMLKNFKKQFGKYLPEGRLETIYDSLVFKSQEEFKRLGESEYCMAFNNSRGQSVMNVDIFIDDGIDAMTQQTIVKANVNHESLHQISRNGSVSGVHDLEAYRGINESFTELINKKSLGKNYPKVAYCGYQPAVKELERLLDYGKIKDKEIFSIYFNNNITQLDDLFKSKFNLDDNSYQRLIEAFYNVTEAQTRDAKNIALNELNKIVTSIVLK